MCKGIVVIFAKIESKFQGSQSMSFLCSLKSIFNSPHSSLLRRAHPRPRSQVIDLSCNVSGGPHRQHQDPPYKLSSVLSLSIQSHARSRLQQLHAPLFLFLPLPPFFLKSSPKRFSFPKWRSPMTSSCYPHLKDPVFNPIQAWPPLTSQISLWLDHLQVWDHPHLLDHARAGPRCPIPRHARPNSLSFLVFQFRGILR